MADKKTEKRVNFPGADDSLDCKSYNNYGSLLDNLKNYIAF